MATLHSTQSFETGQTLTASALTNHVVDATPLPDFIAGQDPLTTPATADQLMINDVDGGVSAGEGKVKKITIANLAGNLPATTVASLTVNGNATVSGTLTNVGGITTSGVTVSADVSVGGLFTASGTSILGGDVTLGNSGYDVTFSGPLAGTIEGTPTINLTSVGDAAGDAFLLKDASDSNKLKTAVGCLPKAWACISTKTADTTTVAATVSRTAGSTTATVTYNAHGFKVGDVIYLDNGVAGGWYDIKTVPDANTFTITTIATTALSSVATQWYALTVNGSGVSSAFKKSTTDNTTQINFSNAMANTNYAVIATFSRDDGVAYGATCCNVIGETNFDKTTGSFSITTNYTSTPKSDGSIMFTVFGDLA